MQEGGEATQVLVARFVKSDYLFCLQNMWRTDKWLCIIVDANEVNGCVGWMRAAEWYVYPGDLPPGFEPVPENYLQNGVPVWAKQQLTDEEQAVLPPSRNDGQLVIGQPHIDYEANAVRDPLRRPTVEEMYDDNDNPIALLQ